jgi:hypothetical protein
VPDRSLTSAFSCKAVTESLGEIPPAFEGANFVELFIGLQADGENVAETKKNVND